MSSPHCDEEILRRLKDEEGYVSGERIARELNISRAAVWKQVCKLRKEGFSIDAAPRSGYRLTGLPDKLTAMEITDALETSVVGKKISYYPKIESTNLLARNLAMDGAEEGTVVIAEEQTRGRGRLDRSWLAPSAKSILMSVIFRPAIQAPQVFSLTMLTSLAIVKAIKNMTVLTPKIKWPNDIYVDDKKIGGILTELYAERDRVNFVVVGVGLNVNFDPSIYPEIEDTATSINKLLGRDISRIKLLRSILSEMDKGYKALKEGKGSQIHTEWDMYSLISGKNVRVISFGTVEEGVAEAVDADGSLILRDKKGKRKRIFSGDVSLRLN